MYIKRNEYLLSFKLFKFVDLLPAKDESFVIISLEDMAIMGL